MNVRADSRVFERQQNLIFGTSFATLRGTGFTIDDWSLRRGLMLNEILTSGTWWFWALLLVQTVAVVCFVERGDPLLAFVSLVFGSIWFFYCFEHIPANITEWLTDLWSRATSNWLSVIGMVFAYAVIGIAWAVFRWWWLVQTIRDNYDRVKAEWLSPKRLREKAALFMNHSNMTNDHRERERFLAWADACSRAAARGGGVLTNELKPIWKNDAEKLYGSQ